MVGTVEVGAEDVAIMADVAGMVVVGTMVVEAVVIGAAGAAMIDMGHGLAAGGVVVVATEGVAVTVIVRVDEGIKANVPHHGEIVMMAEEVIRPKVEDIPTLGGIVEVMVRGGGDRTAIVMNLIPEGLLSHGNVCMSV